MIKVVNVRTETAVTGIVLSHFKDSFLLLLTIHVYDKILHVSLSCHKSEIKSIEMTAVVKSSSHIHQN